MISSVAVETPAFSLKTWRISWAISRSGFSAVDASVAINAPLPRCI